MSKLFHFLGSVIFAIFLLGVTLLFVIVGTFLESATDSHLYAASLTYQNPIFQLLLGLYFVNILFAALRRYPFTWKHLPFLLTHAGLLLLIGGVFWKSVAGVQGAMALKEGGAEQELLLKHTYAIHLVDRENNRWQLPIPKKRTGSLIHEQLELTILAWSPHLEAKLEGFFKREGITLLGAPPLPIGEPKKSGEYTLLGLQEVSPEELSFPGEATIYFLQNADLEETIVAFNSKGEKHVEKIDPRTYYIFDKGFLGYALFATLPPSFPPIEISTPLTQSFSPSPLSKKKEDHTPQITLLARKGEKEELLTLTYEKFGEGFAWPILGGEYLIRFQPLKKPLPFLVRLFRGETTYYPNTTEPYSYEATLFVDETEALLSMNHVYERNGYRFYLANLLTPHEGAKQAQIVVNYDPARYLLTYPGGILLAVGITLLYLCRRYA
ncbi:MAG: hypothetical protein K940chlam9_00979 [Chlamydiae bacterium]|nr:hypothetical protein [Chlamydiota bacterium]